ncbi:MAG: DUF1579 family protein [Planctomycetota bacterium]
MRMLALLLGVAVLLVCPLAAQETPEVPALQPAAELAKCEPFLGNWEGSGTATMAPGAPSMPWTSKSTSKKVLGGHFIQDEIRVDFQGEQEMPPLIMRGYMGWDRERNRFVSVGVSSRGDSGTGEAYWLDDKTLVSVHASVRDGIPTIDREITRITENGMSFTVEHAEGAGSFFIMVEGSMKRSTTPYSISAAEANITMAPASEPMKRIAQLAGSYQMQGNVIPGPGMAKMPISAEEHVKELFGGTVLSFHARSISLPGQPSYEGVGFLFWDANDDCYKQCWLSNMGEFFQEEVRWSGENQLVTTASSLQFGQPGVQRAVINLGDDGAILRVAMDRISAGERVQRAYEGEYKRLPKEVKKGLKEGMKKGY